MIEMKYLFEAAGAFLLVFALVPVVIAACHRWKILDAPGPLKIHARPVPRLGGAAIALALTLSVAAMGISPRSDVAPFLAAVAILAVVGIFDDVRGLSPYTRLAVQFAVGICLGAAGFGVALFNSSVLNVLLSAIVVVTFINAFNFLDGSDGIAAALTAVMAIAYILTGASNASPLSAAIIWALAGSTIAFLTFNWPPAKIFMGDSGSTVLGLAVAFLALEHLRAVPTYSHPGVTLFPFVVAAVPLADAAFAIVRRIQSASSPLAGDRRHFYDLIREKAVSSEAAVYAAVAVTAVAGVVGWLATRVSDLAAIAMIALVAAGLVTTGAWLGSFRFRMTPRSPHTSTTPTTPGVPADAATRSR